MIFSNLMKASCYLINSRKYLNGRALTGEKSSLQPYYHNMKLSDLCEGSTIDGDHGHPFDSQPKWLDKEKFKRGQKFIRENIFSCLLAMHFSLVVGFSINNLLGPLVFTKQSSTPMTALRRYMQTFRYLLAWFYGDLWDDKEDPGYKSVRTVRRMHGSVAKSMNKDKNGGDLFISQYDMAIVQTGFFSAMFMYPDSFGIKYTKDDLMDFVHFWRGVGYILGISDEYNICQGSYEDVYKISREIEKELLLPALRDPPKMFRTMAQAYCDGLNISNSIRLHSTEADSAVALDAMGVSMPLGFWDKVRFYFWKTVLFLCRWGPGFRSFMNKSTLNELDKVTQKYLGRSLMISSE